MAQQLLSDNVVVKLVLEWVGSWYYIFHQAESKVFWGRPPPAERGGSERELISIHLTYWPISISWKVTLTM